MKKLISLSSLALSVLFANAQLKVYSGGKVYVGGTGTTPNSVLSVGGAGNSLYQGYFYNSSTTSGSTGIRSEVIAPTNNSNSAIAINGTGGFAGLGKSFGIYGFSGHGTAQSNGYAVGVYGEAKNALSGNNYGVWGHLTASNHGAGILGTSNNYYPSVPGIYAAYFVGDIRTTDDTPEKPTGNSWTAASDSRIKKNVNNFKDGLSVLRHIRPVNYELNGVGGFATGKTHIGVLAQEVQQVAPYCIGKTKIIIKDSEKSSFASDIIGSVQKDSLGEDRYLAEILNYNPDGLFYVMINSIKELDSTVTELKKQLAGQRNGNGSSNSETTLQVDLANNNNVILYQNQPNPFDGSTTIRFFIPENTIGTAYVAFYDMYGKEVNKLELKEKGFGKIEANTENLSSGIYSYSIIVNDKVIDTKKMLKNK